MGAVLHQNRVGPDAAEARAECAIEGASMRQIVPSPAPAQQIALWPVGEVQAQDALNRKAAVRNSNSESLMRLEQAIRLLLLAGRHQDGAIAGLTHRAAAARNVGRGIDRRVRE